MPTTRTDIILAEVASDVTALEAGLGHDDPSIRALSLGSLDRVGNLENPTLAHAFLDQNRDVRCRAVELAITRSSIPLAPLLADTDDLVVETAAWALGEREENGSETIEALVETATSHEVSICREAAIAALGAIGSEAGLPAILQGLEDRAPVRRRAILALAPFSSPEVTEALERATQDRDRQVRQAAEDLL
jgi:HEAT repeat protein